MVTEDKGFKVIDKRGVEEKEPAAAAPPAAAPTPAGSESLPEIDFLTFVLSLSTSALYHLGEVPDAETAATRPPDLPLAKQTIDILAILQEKTKGNLSGEEERILDNVLYDLRLKFVERAKGKSTAP